MKFCQAASVRHAVTSRDAGIVPPILSFAPLYACVKYRCLEYLFEKIN